MSQAPFDHRIEDLERLEAAAALKENEAREARAELRARLTLARQQQHSIATAPPHNPDFLSASQSNFQLSSLPTSDPQGAGLQATPRHGNLTVHTGFQPSVREVPQALPSMATS